MIDSFIVASQRRIGCFGIDVYTLVLVYEGNAVGTGLLVCTPDVKGIGDRPSKSVVTLSVLVASSHLSLKSAYDLQT